MPERNKIYFLSDFHLGVPDYETSLRREKLVVSFLDSIKNDAKEIFLVGDVFDFWFEYKTVVPKGYVRLLGKLAELSDAGIKLHYFTGNHDMWVFDYFTKELNIPVYRGPVERQFYGKKFFIGHGDGLGPGDHGYKFIKKVFANKFCQWLFARIHPNLGIAMANFWSRRSRIATGHLDETYLGDDKEFLIQFCKETLSGTHYDYFVFGHRHLPLEKQVGPNSTYINLGDWLKYNTYAVFDGSKMQLLKFPD